MFFSIYNSKFWNVLEIWFVGAMTLRALALVEVNHQSQWKKTRVQTVPYLWVPNRAARLRRTRSEFFLVLGILYTLVCTYTGGILKISQWLTLAILFVIWLLHHIYVISEHSIVVKPSSPKLRKYISLKVYTRKWQ